MMSSVASVVGGAVLAAIAVLGGVSAISPGPNTQAQSDAVVVYDAR